MVSSQGVNELGYHKLVHGISSQGVNMELVNFYEFSREKCIFLNPKTVICDRILTFSREKCSF